MNETRGMGCVGKLKYEVHGGALMKADLRRIVFHLLTVCEDFDPSDFENVAALVGAGAEPEPDETIDARKRIETPEDFVEWLDGVVGANDLLGVSTLLDSGIVEGERVLFLMLDGETLMTLNTKIRVTVAAHPLAEEGGAHG